MATFLGGVAVLVATALGDDPGLRRLAWLRVGCAGSGSLLVAASALGVASGVALAAGGLGLVLAAYSIALARRRPDSLQAVLDRLVAGGDAAWRDEFERPFAAYLRRHQPGAPARAVRDSGGGPPVDP
jgi:hypothetical protein